VSDFKELANKLVIEVKFRPNLLYFSEMFKIASSIEEDYEDWQAKHNPSEGLLIDNTLKKSLKITSNSLTLILENNELFSKLKEEAHQIFLLFLEPTKIKKITRIGVRRMGVYESSVKYQSLVNNFYDSFYANAKAIKDIAADSVEDVAFILDGVKDGYRNHVRLGPLKPEQAPIYYQTNFNEQLELKKETNLYLDVDTYTDVENDYDTAEKSVDGVIDNNKAVFTEFLKLAKEKL
jgi:hypothetical protein